MAEYTIDKIEYGGNTYKLQDNISGYIKLSDIPLASATANGIVPMSGTDTKPRILSARANGLVYWENFEIWDATTQQQVGEYTQDEEGVYLGINEATTTAPGLMSKEDKIAINTIPTKTSDLTNDSGFITSYTDEKVKWTVASVPSSGTTTYYPLVNTSTATTSTLNTIAGFNLEYSAAATSRTLVLGHSTNIGVIKLYQGTSSSKYVTIEPSSDVSASRTIQLPNASGTLALTSNITDTKVSTAAISASTSYYPVLGTNTTSATTKYYDSTGLGYIYTTEDNLGIAELILGNSSSEGTSGNKKGLITFYSNNDKRVFLRTINGLTANIGIYLPASEGTLALTSDLSDYVAKSGDTMTGALTMANGKYFQGKNADGDNRIVCGISSDNTYMFGYGSRSSSEGGSYFDGHVVNIRSNGLVNITAPSGVANSGTYNDLVKITSLTVSVSAGSSGTTQSTADYTLTAPATGYKPVGIIGMSLQSYNVEVVEAWISSDTVLRAAFRRRATTSSAYNIYFRILWMKATGTRA